MSSPTSTECGGGKWAEMAVAVADLNSCPTEYLKIGHLSWRVLPRKKGARKSDLEPIDRWEDEAEGPDVFNYQEELYEIAFALVWLKRNHLLLPPAFFTPSGRPCCPSSTR